MRWPRLAGGLTVGAIAGVALVAAGCSRSSTGTGAGAQSSVDPRTGTSASKRLYAEGQTIPKGGGSYKIGAPYRIGTRWYVPTEDPNYDRVGLGSWYGTDFHGRKTANGEIFDMNALTAAHPTLPIPSYAYVTNLSNNRTILVRINDRGPYAHDRVIDMSRRSARELGFELHGVTKVRVKYAGRAPLNGNDIHEQRFLASQSGSRSPAFASTPHPTYAPQPAYTPPPARSFEPPPTQSAASTMPTGLAWRR